MGTDDWLNSNTYGGSGSAPKEAPLSIVKTNNLLSSVFCDMTNYPGYVQDFSVTYNYEAYFTGAIDSASLASDIKNMNSKLIGYLASASGLCDTVSCTPNSVNCVAQYTKSLVDKTLMGVSKNTTDVIQTNCKYFAVFLSLYMEIKAALIHCVCVFNISVIVCRPMRASQTSQTTPFL